jgi:outer membrane receptor for ferrienterochelin and colicin
MTNGLQHLIFFRVIPAVFCLFLSIAALNATNLPDSVAQKTFTLHVKKAPIERVLDEMSKQTGLLFSYRTATLAELNRFSFSNKSFTVESFLQQVFVPNGMQYSFIAPNVIVLRPIHAPPPKRFVVSGVISDSLSGERLVGANIFLVLDKNGIVTNNDGFYSFQQNSDSLVMVVSYVGFNTKTIALKLGSNMRLDISLSPSILLNPVLVSNNNTANTVIQEGGNTITLKGKQITEISPLFGEADVFRTLQLLPGVQSVGEGTPGLYVRGGSPEQNLVLLDGVQVYNPVHIFGFYSIFNPGIISHVSLTKGSFPAQYGGRLSSVIDVVSKDGNERKLKGAVMVGLIGTSLLLEGPLQASGKTTFFVAGRRSHIDLLLSPFVDATLSTGKTGFLSAYFFYDLNGKIVHRFSNKTKLSLQMYGGRDRVALRNTFKLDNPNRAIREEDYQSFSWGNTLYSLKLSHVLNASTLIKASVWSSAYNFRNTSEYKFSTISAGNTSQQAFRYNYLSSINDVGVKVDLEHYLRRGLKIRTGFITIAHQFRPGISTLTTNLPNLTPERSVSSVVNGIEQSFFVEGQIKVSAKWQMKVGAHTAVLRVDSVFYPSIQPRIQLSYEASKKLFLTVGYAEMVQFLHLLTHSTIGIPSDLWILSNKSIAPQTNKQWNIGAQYRNNKWVIGWDAFYKQMNRVVEYKEATNFLKNNANWEDKITVGEGLARGIEFYVEKQVGKWTGWVGYCWSKSTRTFEEINNGLPFLFRYDRRHDLSSTATYYFKKNWLLNVNYVFATGNPITLPEQIYSGIAHGAPSIDIYIPGERNAYILPNYHRMDVNVSHKKTNKWGERVWTFGTYNTSNRQNPFFITPAYNDLGERVLRQITLFPFIPSFSYKQNF